MCQIEDWFSSMVATSNVFHCLYDALDVLSAASTAVSASTLSLLFLTTMVSEWPKFAKISI